jgi:RNA polymerase sigma-70 factor (ECF subfamily)
MAISLEIPEGTVKSRLRRGREQLRDAIERLAGNPDLAHSTVDGIDTWAAKVRERVGKRKG